MAAVYVVGAVRSTSARASAPTGMHQHSRSPELIPAPVRSSGCVGAWHLPGLAPGPHAPPVSPAQPAPLAGPNGAHAEHSAQTSQHQELSLQLVQPSQPGRGISGVPATIARAVPRPGALDTSSTSNPRILGGPGRRQLASPPAAVPRWRRSPRCCARQHDAPRSRSGPGPSACAGRTAPPRRAKVGAPPHLTSMPRCCAAPAHPRRSCPPQPSRHGSRTSSSRPR